MSNQIVEELPTAAPVAGGGAKDKLEKQARQLAYDVKYKVKQQMNRGTKLDPAAVKKAYLSFLGRATGSPQVKALAKKRLLGEGYIDVDQFVQDSVVNALVNEFGGNKKIEESKNEYLQQLEESEDRKYKVRVTDKKTGNTYVRMATRAKISELRANTNIASVEMTGYGEPSKSSAQASGSTSEPKKAKKDFDGDGKVESPTAEYKGSKDKAIKKAIAKEDFIIDAKDEEKSNGKIEELKKGKSNKIKVMPSIGEQKGDCENCDCEGCGQDPCVKCGESHHVIEDKKKKEEEEDPRSMGTKYRNMKNKLRAMGLQMSHEPEGETIEESEKVAAGALKRAKELGAKRRRREGVNRGVDKNERAGYRLSQAASSSGSSLETQRTKKKRPAGDDTSQIGHYKKRDEKVTVGKKGKPLKQAKYKLSLSQRVDHHSNKALNRRDPKQNPKHTANEEFVFTEEFITERVDFAVNYFFNEGINEDGLDLIIEEVGLDTFLDFVLDQPQELNEDEAAYQKAKKKAISGSDRREREGKGEYSPKGSSSPYAKQGLGAKTKKKPKIGHTGTKVVAATQKAKKAQPAKPASKEGLGSKIRGFVKKGVERHQKARAAGRVPEKRAKEFGKGVVSGVKDTVKFAGKVKKAVVGEEKALQIISIIRKNRLNEEPAVADKRKEEQQQKKVLSTKERLNKRKILMQKQTLQLQKQGKLPLNYSEETDTEKKFNWRDELSELNRYEKETGKSSGGVSGRSDINTPRKGTPTKTKEKPTAVSVVKSKTMRPMTGRPQGQKKSDHAARHKEQDRPETPARTMQRKRHDPRDEVEKATQGRYSKTSRYD